MNIFAEFSERIGNAVKSAGFLHSEGHEVDLSRMNVEPPRDSAHGDLATNVAMVMSKQVKQKPRDIAAKIAIELEKDPDISRVDIAGPGFINLTLDPAFWGTRMLDIIRKGKDYGRSDAGRGVRINVEYVSTNPTGPMHVGHTRGAVLGDVISSLLAFTGWDVCKEFYINDAGAQVDVLARSAHLRYLEALGETINIPEGLYPGDYLVPVGMSLAKSHGDKFQTAPESDWLEIFREKSLAQMMSLIRSDLKALNVFHDVFSSEAELVQGERNMTEEAIAFLKDKNQVYFGTLPPPKGQKPDDWEDREQLLFRSTEFGDDIDRPLKKSDGSNTYFANDIAYHYDKYKRGFSRQIDILGADHGGYVKRMKAAVSAITEGKGALEVRLCQLVKLYKNGEPVKMSKRSGNFVTLIDLVDEVGSDAIRFMMMYRKSDAPLDFDFDKVTEQSKENPVFYVQYAHARTASIFRQAKNELPDMDMSPEALLKAQTTVLIDAGEITLIRKLLDFPRVIDGAAESLEPHRVAFYLYELAGELHQQWNRGKETPQLRFINSDDKSLTLARLALVRAVAFVLSSGLDILGVSAPQEMR